MKPEVQAKFLQHLNRKNKDGGFTLIELLVVIIIIGILAAIALPSFLNQAQKGKQSESKQYVGAVNRAQQSYFLENGKFATASVGDLGIGINTQTQNYAYTVAAGTIGTSVDTLGQARVSALKSYGGHTYLTTSGATSDTTSLAVLCETLGASQTFPAFTAHECPGGTTNVK